MSEPTRERPPTLERDERLSIQQQSFIASRHSDQTRSSTPISRADDWEAHWATYASSAQFNPGQAFRRD